MLEEEEGVAVWGEILLSREFIPIISSAKLTHNSSASPPHLCSFCRRPQNFEKRKNNNEQKEIAVMSFDFST